MAMVKSLRGKTGKTQQSFPNKLHIILERSEVDGYSNIISWLPHGRAFEIYDQALFLETIMPKFFYQTKMPSFMRQLSSYGFQKIIADENNKGAYYNSMFLRGRSGLCNAISRHQKRPLLNPDNEPDLDLLEPMPPSDVPLKANTFQITNNEMKEKARPRVIHYADPFAVRRLQTSQQPIQIASKDSRKNDVITFFGAISGQKLNIYPCQSNSNAPQNFAQSQRQVQRIKPSADIRQTLNVRQRIEVRAPSTYILAAPPSSQNKSYLIRKKLTNNQGMSNL